MNMEDISNSLKKYFKSIKKSQSSIAQDLGTTQSYVAIMLSGKQPFGRVAAKKWEEAFGLSSAWLMTGEGDMLVEKQGNTNTQTFTITGDTLSGGSMKVGGNVSQGADETLLQLFQEQQRQNAKWQEMMEKLIDKITK